MNKIVRDHYPVANLPEDLREGLMAEGTVRIVIEETAGIPDRFEYKHRKPMTAAEAVESIRKYKAEGHKSVTAEEAVARIRALRDEWDDE